MEINKIRLAGRVVEVTTCCAGFGVFVEEYLTQDAADMAVRITPDAIAEERKRAEKEAEFEGIPMRDHTDAYLEQLAVLRSIALEMTQYDTLLMHGSCIAVDGEAYLFAARSGTGKSTHTRLWRERFGSRAVMVNDDKPFVRVEDGAGIAFGTPWNGKHHLSTPMQAKLKALCILKRGEENRIEQLTAAEAYPHVLAQCNRPENPQALMKTMQLCDALVKNTPVYCLYCNMDPDAARVSYEMMSKEGMKNEA